MLCLIYKIEVIFKNMNEKMLASATLSKNNWKQNASISDIF